MRLVNEQGLSLTSAARDLDIHLNVLRSLVKDYQDGPTRAFPGHGQMKPVQADTRHSGVFQLSQGLNCWGRQIISLCEIRLGLYAYQLHDYLDTNLRVTMSYFIRLLFGLNLQITNVL